MKKGVSITINISNRAIYTFLLIIGLILLATGVYAVTGVSHSGDEIIVTEGLCQNILGHGCGYDSDSDTNTQLSKETVQAWADEVDDIGTTLNSNSALSIASLSATGIIHGGGDSGNAFQIGNDAYITDINIANTLAVKGIQNGGNWGSIEVGSIKLASSSTLPYVCDSHNGGRIKYVIYDGWNSGLEVCKKCSGGGYCWTRII